MKDKYEKKILIVDDESANILLLNKMLAFDGYKNIITTLDPKEVLLLHKENGFDMILLDINMPEMDGYAVLEQLRNMDDFSTTAVVAISGDTSPSDIKKALEAGFVNYITKPMKMNELLEMIDKALMANV